MGVRAHTGRDSKLASAFLNASHAARHGVRSPTRASSLVSAPSPSCKKWLASRFVVPGQFEAIALACHADRDVSDPGPGVEPGPQRVRRRHGPYNYRADRRHHRPGSPKRWQSALVIGLSDIEGVVTGGLIPGAWF